MTVANLSSASSSLSTQLEPQRPCRLRVLVLSHQFPNDYEPAAGIYVLEQIRAARKAGADSVVIVPTAWVPPFFKDRPRYKKYASLPVQAVVDGFNVKYPRVPTLPRAHLFGLSGVLFYASCRHHVRQLLHNVHIDLIHAHTVMPDGFAAVLLGREFNLPVVCTIHGSDVNIYPWRDRLSYLCIQWALSHSDRLIAVSHRLKEKIMDIAGPRDVTVIHNGADTEKFDPQNKLQARSALGLPLSNQIIVFVGNLWEVKGVSCLLQAIRKINRPNISLYVIGDGDIRPRLTREAAEAGLTSCSFVGYQPHDRIPLWLSAADCLVLPSLSEGLPTILCEAMLCKTPIVAADVGGVSEIVSNRISGLVVPAGNPAALAAAIREQLEDSELSSVMVENARKAAEQHLTWQANVSKLIPVYKSALVQGAYQGHSSRFCGYSKT